MPRIINYPESTNPDENEVVLIDGSQGNKKLKIKNLLKSIWNKFTEVDEEISDINEALSHYNVLLESSLNDYNVHSFSLSNINKYKFILIKLDLGNSNRYRFGNVLVPKNIFTNPNYDEYAQILTGISSNPYAMYLHWNATTSKVEITRTSNTPGTLYFTIIGIY